MIRLISFFVAKRSIQKLYINDLFIGCRSSARANSLLAPPIILSPILLNPTDFIEPKSILLMPGSRGFGLPLLVFFAVTGVLELMGGSAPKFLCILEVPI